MVGIRLFVDEGLGHSSYLIDLADGTAAILDPPRFPTEHLTAAATQGTTPRWTIDTHSHADYVTAPGHTPDHHADIVGTVIDVRQRSEYEAGHVPGASNIELGISLTLPFATAR